MPDPNPNDPTPTEREERKQERKDERAEDQTAREVQAGAAQGAAQGRERGADRPATSPSCPRSRMTIDPVRPGCQLDEFVKVSGAMKFVVPAFSGMAPRFADMLLDDVQASDAANLKVTNGNLQGLPRPAEARSSWLTPPGGVYRKVKKLYKPGTDEFLWWGHPGALACIVNGPLVNDAFDRVYISAPAGRPVVTTWDYLDTGADIYHQSWACPRPGGGSWGHLWRRRGTDIRAYVYAFVTGVRRDRHAVRPDDACRVTSTTRSRSPCRRPTPSASTSPAIDIYRTATGGQTCRTTSVSARSTGATTTFVDSMALDQVPLQLPLTCGPLHGPADGPPGAVPAQLRRAGRLRGQHGLLLRAVPAACLADGLPVHCPIQDRGAGAVR